MKHETRVWLEVIGRTGVCLFLIGLSQRISILEPVWEQNFLLEIVFGDYWLGF